MRPDGRAVNPTRASTADGGDALVELGRIVNHHGVRGEVRMLPYNPETTMLERVPTVVLRDAGGALEQRAVLGTRPHKRFLLLRFERCDSIEAAAPLIGRTVCVPRRELPPLGEQEYYHVELVGCAVRTETGEDVGVIVEVLSTGSNDVCVVRDGAREVLIPLIADVLVHLDIARRAMIVRAIPGLLNP